MRTSGRLPTVKRKQIEAVLAGATSAQGLSAWTTEGQEQVAGHKVQAGAEALIEVANVTRISITIVNRISKGASQ